MADISSFDDLISRWNDLHNASRIPNFLYHYTTFEGLLGILQHDGLRATFSKTLNDGSEWEYGKAIVDKYPKSQTVANAFFSPAPPTAVFVSCFCEDPNLLSMWRSYTGQGGGFCLGFEGPQLHTLQRTNLEVGSFGARLVKVQYGEKLPIEMESVLEHGEHAIAGWLLENMIKHPGFKEENEWRIIVPDPPASIMSFHSAHAAIKASVQIRNEYGDKKLPLKKIIYGPTLRNDPALKQTLTWMLERYRYSHVELEACRIPYRL